MFDELLRVCCQAAALGDPGWSCQESAAGRCWPVTAPASRGLPTSDQFETTMSWATKREWPQWATTHREQLLEASRTQRRQVSMDAVLSAGGWIAEQAPAHADYTMVVHHSDLAEGMGVSRITALTALAALVDAGLVERTGTTRYGAHWYRWTADP